MTARARSRYADSQQLSDDAVADISRMVEEELQSIDFVHPVDFEIFAERLARAPRRAALMIALGTLFEPLPLLHFALSLVDAHQDPDGRTALLSGFASHVAPYLGEPSLAQVGSFVEAWLDERLDAHVRRGGRFHDFPALAYVAPAFGARCASRDGDDRVRVARALDRRVTRCRPRAADACGRFGDGEARETRRHRTAPPPGIDRDDGGSWPRLRSTGSPRVDGFGSARIDRSAGHSRRRSERCGNARRLQTQGVRRPSALVASRPS